MASRSSVAVRKFVAQFEHAMDAQLFLDECAGKGGKLDDKIYRCARYGRGGPAGANVSVFLELTEAKPGQNDGHPVNFAELLSKAQAKEV